MFQDRLVNNEDRNWFETLLQSKISTFGIESKDVMQDKTVLYGDFMNPNADPRPYEEIIDISKVQSVTYNYSTYCIRTLSFKYFKCY